MEENRVARIVLIVDDDPHARIVAHDLLLPDGYALVLAANGAEAIDLAVKVRPDVVLSDLMMPEMDGITLCEQLRSRPETRATPIIIATALDSRADMIRALDAGATDFLSKPLQGIELRARVRSMMRIANETRLLHQVLDLRTNLVNMALHDMRSPLQSIAFATESLRRHPTTESLAPLRRLSDGIARLQKLIDEMLVAARSEAGELTLAVEPLDLDTLVRKAAEDAREAAERSGIAIDVQPSGISVSADPSLIRRCVENLLTNAIKFSPAGTNVSLHTSRVEREVHLEVADRGPGIPEQERERIFEPFKIVEGGPRSQLQLGLGLAFCQMVARAHGGTIHVSSREGGGSVFRLTLPDQPATAGIETS
jgi:two-component system sensor histidine kinase/response regulator